jgi:hypothetical protein
MSGHTFTAFDDWIETPDGELTYFYSSARHDEPLGLLDQVTFMVSAEAETGADPAIQVELLHSADGLHWLKKTLVEPVDYVLVVDQPQNNVRVGLDDGALPSLRFVRFRIGISNEAEEETPSCAHVRIQATINDVRQNAFSRRITRVIRALERKNPCAQVIQGGSHVGYTEWAYKLHSGQHGMGIAMDRKTMQMGQDLAKLGIAGFDGGFITGNCDAVGAGRHGVFDWECDYQVADDASICVGHDGSVIASREGKGSVFVHNPAAGDLQGC